MENIAGEGGEAPTTFAQLFASMGDVYNGVYAPFLAEYSANNGDTPEAVMLRTVTQLPADQVPAVLLYQDMHRMIRVVQHIHNVDRPFGQPANPLTGAILGFSGEVQHITRHR